MAQKFTLILFMMSAAMPSVYGYSAQSGSGPVPFTASHENLKKDLERSTEGTMRGTYERGNELLTQQAVWVTTSMKELDAKKKDGKLSDVCDGDLDACYLSIMRRYQDQLVQIQKALQQNQATADALRGDDLSPVFVDSKEDEFVRSRPKAADQDKSRFLSQAEWSVLGGSEIENQMLLKPYAPDPAQFVTYKKMGDRLVVVRDSKGNPKLDAERYAQAKALYEERLKDFEDLRVQIKAKELAKLDAQSVDHSKSYLDARVRDDVRGPAKSSVDSEIQNSDSHSLRVRLSEQAIQAKIEMFKRQLNLR